MKIESRIKEINQKEIEIISNKYKISSKIAKLILSRTLIEDVDSFMFPNINHLFSPFLLSSMNDILKKIEEIKINNLKVVVYGDYDVDGITATSLLYSFFKEEKIKVEYFIPSRTNGYGLTQKSIDDMIEKFSPNIIFTVDCGITSINEVEYIKNKNIDIVVTDHHTPLEKLPNCLILNPHIEKSLPFEDLCGVGVAFKIIEAYYNLDKSKYIKYLPIVAIGIIADVVPLIKDNRIMVQVGLSVASFLPVGVKKLLKSLDISINDLNSQNIAYKLAPSINSVGRLKNADIAVKLFTLTDEIILDKICDEIIKTNKERQQITEEIFSTAENELLKGKIPSIIVLKNSKWDAGVIGIVASKLLDKYKRTTILFTESKGILKGSCRSVCGINIFEQLKNVEEYILQYGGHEKAAGLTILLENFDNFKTAINNNISLAMKDIEVIDYYDLKINTNEIDINFAKQLSILEPFGESNPSPVFLLDMYMPEVEFMKKNDKHIMLKYENLKVKYFNADKQILNYKNFCNSSNLIKISTSLFNNFEYLNIICDDAIFYNLNKKENQSMLERNHYKILKGNLKFSLTKEVNVEDIINEKNFIICVYTKQNFEMLEKIFKDTVTYTIGSVAMCEKRRNICFCLENFSEIQNFEKAYFVEEKIGNFANLDNKYLIKNFKDYQGIALSREKLITCYYAIDRFNNNKQNILNEENYFLQVSFDFLYDYFSNSYSNFDLTFEEFMKSMLIFEELKIVKYLNESFVIDKTKKCDLSCSKIFNIDF